MFEWYTRPPGGSLFADAGRVVELCWCPGFVCTDLSGNPEIRFKWDTRPAKRRGLS